MGKVGVALALACALAWTTGAQIASARPFGVQQCKPRVLHQFVSGEDIPESVTADPQGNLYISVGNTIRRRTPSGEMSLFGTLPLPIFALGVKVGPDGCVYTASTSLSEIPGAFVWRVCGEDSVEVYAELDASGGPNDLAFDSRGDLFVTDPVLGRVWKVAPDGTPTVFVDHPLLDGDPEDPALLFSALGVNGIAFDKRERYMYLSNTDAGSVLRIDMRKSSPSPVVFVQDPWLRGADGIAFDRGGTLFVTVNALDALVSINPGRQLRVLGVGGAFDAPSSVVFGALHQDRHTLYVTSSAFSRTLGLQPGTPQPALLGMRAKAPGLPLP